MEILDQDTDIDTKENVSKTGNVNEQSQRSVVALIA